MDESPHDAQPSEPLAAAALRERYDAGLSEFRGGWRAQVEPARLAEAMRCLREEFGFDLLVDVTCVDYLHYRDARDRFVVTYLLASTSTNQRLTVRTPLNEPELTLPSMRPLWEAANWLEREVFDMFGILFEGHGDLRRILMPEAFTAHPLRKDYPLQGHGERHNFPSLHRRDA